MIYQNIPTFINLLWLLLVIENSRTIESSSWITRPQAMLWHRAPAWKLWRAVPCHAMPCREAPAMKCETKARERSERPWRSWSFAETGSHLNPDSKCFNPMVSREDKLGIWCQDSPKNVVLRINPGFIAPFGQLRSQVCLCPRHGISTSRHLARLAKGRNMSKYSKWKLSILQPLAWPCLVTASSQG